MDKQISTLLREVKEATGWTEPQIAEEIGTSQPTVNRILNGQDECKNKTLRAIEALHSRVAAPQPVARTRRKPALLTTSAPPE